MVNLNVVVQGLPQDTAVLQGVCATLIAENTTDFFLGF